MIRTLKKGIDYVNSLCGNFPRFTSFYNKDGSERINGGVCRLFLKNKKGKYTIPTPFFGFWSGDFAGEREFYNKENNRLDVEEYYELSIAGDCVHNFTNFSQKNVLFDDRAREKYKFYEPNWANDIDPNWGEDGEPFGVGFDGEPIYPDVLFSDFIYSTVFNFGKECWNRFFEIVGKYIFMSSPTWGIVEQGRKFGNRFWKEVIRVEDVVVDLMKTFKMGEIVLDNSKEFRMDFENMCDACLLCKCPDESLDGLGRWLVSKGYQLNEIEKMYCYVDAFNSDGEMCFERGFGYDFAEIAFALLKKKEEE